jgi:hypothetical protein
MNRPEIAQERWFRQLLYSARNTEIGRKYHFDEIRNYHQFAQNVPAHDYEKIKSYISRMMHGESDILWPGEVEWYSKSSGTTSDKSKFIPVTRANLYKCHLAGSWDSLALLYHHKPNLEIFQRKNLLMPGSYQHLVEFPRTKYGDISALLLQNMPAIGKAFYTPDFDTALSSNFEEKIERIADLSSKRDDIVMFGGVPTWIIVLFRMILEKTGKSNMLEVWPHLQVYMHGGVGFSPYRETFKKLIPSDDFIYQEIYNASEGYFGAQCDFAINDMLLLLDNGVFYEFIPMDQWDEEYPKTVPITEVEIGKNYAIMISTNAGLWRYMPGDTIMFTNARPYTFNITGRTKQFINAFGEEVMVGDTDKALALTCKALDCIVAEYTAAPLYIQGACKGGHQWVIEFERAPDNLQRFNILLDEHLQKINSDYEAKRFKSMALDMLRIEVVPSNTFCDWMKARGKYGSQHKVPRLANHRQYIEELLVFSKKYTV